METSLIRTSTGLNCGMSNMDGCTLAGKDSISENLKLLPFVYSVLKGERRVSKTPTDGVVTGIRPSRVTGHFGFNAVMVFRKLENATMRKRRIIE